MCSIQIGLSWRYVSGGVERSCDDRFDISEHSEGFSVYDSDHGSAFTHTYKSKRTARAACDAVRAGRVVSYELDRRSA